MMTERTLDSTKRGDADFTIRHDYSVTSMTGAQPVALDGTVRSDGMTPQGGGGKNEYFILKGVNYRNVNVLSDNSGEA
jgi:hypothetical protein